MTQSSRAGLPLIKSFEGLRLSSYLCPAGVWTIGYGRTTGVRQGQHCTEVEADKWLAEEYDAFEKGLLAKLKVTLNANQLGAVVSLAYNIGLANFGASTLLKLLNAGKLNEAAAQFARWNKAAGKVLPGLSRRRAAEAALFAQAA